MTGAFDGGSQGALMQCAGPGLPSWSDLAIFRDEATQHIRILVVDTDILVYAELADLGARYITARTRKSFIFICIFF